MGKEAELIKAAKKGDLRTLERYLGQNIKRVSVMGSIRKTLHPNIQDELGYTLLHHATLNGHREVVSFLLQNGASTTIPDSSGSYPLHLASWKGDIEIVRLLVTQGPSRPNVDQQSNSEDTALHLASQYGYCGVVEFLLERHASPLVKNVRGETPLDLAAQFGHLDTVLVLISHCPEILRLSRPDISPLHLAARNGHSVIVLSLINAGISVNTVCTTGSALHEAAMCGKQETVKLLLDKGIDISLKDSNGKTILAILTEIPATRARKIHSLISEYAEKTHVPKKRYMTPRSYRLLAIPVCDSNNDGIIETGTKEELPRLKYREGESIVIDDRISIDVYIGTLHKIRGTFPIKDMRIFQDIEGKLHEVDRNNISDFIEDGGLHVLQNRDNQSQHLKKNGSHRQRRGSHDNGGNKKKGKSKRTHKMTDTEKKFILSKDTGAYSQLTPISAPDPVTARVKEVSSPPGGGTNKSKDGQYLGSYYLLEIENVDVTSNPDERDDIPSPPSHPPPHPREDIPPPPIEPPPQPSPESVAKALKKTRSVPQYENIKLDCLSEPSQMLRTKSYNESRNVEHAVERPRSKTTRTVGYENVHLHDTKGFPSYGKTLHIDQREPFNHDVSSQIPLSIDEPSLDNEEGVSVPISIPNSHRNYEYSHTRCKMEETDGVDFKIVETKRDPYEDVVVSSLNPNYSRVELRKKPHPPEDQKVWTDSPDSPIWIVPRSSDPFAGLIESGSVTHSSSDIENLEGLPSPRDRLRSVWDDGRVSREWNKVDDVLEVLNSSIQNYESTLPPLASKATPTSEESTFSGRSSVGVWLSGMSLGGYANIFESNGFDDIRFLGGNIMTISDLKELGITGHDQGTIVTNLSILSPPPRVREAKTIQEWLSLLNLSHLEGYFENYDLKKVSSLWEIQISTVLGVEEIGYCKRLLYGIHELRAGHPDWTRSPVDTAVQLHEEGLRSNSPMSDISFVKDYRHIRSLRKDNSAVDPLVNNTTNNTDSLLHDENELPWIESGLMTSSTTPTDTSSKLTIDENNCPSVDDSTTPSIPVRGNDYATIRKDDDDTVIQTERKRTTFAPPPAKIHNYNTWYLGSAVVKGLAGKHSAEEACLKLRTQTDGIAKIPQIILSISWKGVKFVDAISKMIVSNHHIQDISHCCPDIEDPRVFAYMTKEKETGRSYCHVFMANTKETTDEIIMTVGQAFEVAYQAVIRARGGHKPVIAPEPETVQHKSIFKSSFRKFSPKHRSSERDDMK